MGFLESIRDIVEQFVGPRIDARTVYAGRVISQRSDGTLDIKPESSSLSAITQSPVAYGVPGASARIRAGARAFFQFVDGDTGHPIVVGFEPGAATEIVLDASRVKLAGDIPIARKGDLVSVVITKADLTALGVASSAGLPSKALGGVIVSGSSVGATK